MNIQKKLTILYSLLSICIISMIVLAAAGLIIPEQNISYRRRFTLVCPLSWNNIATGLMKADAEMGTHTLMLGADRMNIDLQVQAIHDAILSRPDGIITAAPVDSDAFREVLEEADSSGIPVVLVDSDLPGSSRRCYIGTDNTASGTLAGKDMYTATGGHAHICALVSDLDYPNQSERVNAFRAQIEQYPDMEILHILECHSERLEILNDLPKILEEDPSIDALYITEAIAGSIVGNILQEKFPDRKITVVATDNISSIREYIRSGVYYSSISQDPLEQGYLAGIILNRILDGNTPESIIHTKSLSLNRTNIDSFGTESYSAVQWIMY